jgi:hypothetical protein
VSLHAVVDERERRLSAGHTARRTDRLKAELAEARKPWAVEAIRRR